MAGSRSIFLSYSRKDYYFAESLAFELHAHGVDAWLDAKDLQPGAEWRGQLEDAIRGADCFVLLASRHSLASEVVRSEYERARAAGKRIVVAHLDRTPLPDALRECAALSVRGPFGAAVRRLVAQLDANAAPRRARPSVLAFPPWVAFVSLALIIPAAVFLSLGDWSAKQAGALEGLPNYAVYLLLLLGIAALFWFITLAFVQRRMGMTRLAICLGFICFAFANPVYRYVSLGAGGLADYKGTIAPFIAGNLGLALALAALPFAALLGIVLLRPADLLRWTPTGKVWPWYRVGRASASNVEIIDPATAFARVRRFVLVHDPADAPMAQRLREELLQAGASEAPRADAQVTTVILLTQLSSVALVDAQRGVTGPLLGVVGTGIRLRDALDWLWRRQWIDFRAWTVTAPDREKGLPRVPEALTRTRVPRAVRIAHHWLCALGAVFFVSGGAQPHLVQADEFADAATQMAATMHAMVYFGLWMWFAILAGKLLRRRISRRAFFGWVFAGLPVAIITMGMDLSGPLSSMPGGWRVLPLMLLAPAAAAWFIRARKAFDYWFPATRAWKGAQDARLGMERNWDTLTWFVAYLMLLALISGLVQS